MNVTQLIRFILTFVGCVLIAGCASDEPLKFSTTDRTPVAGESTPPPQTGPRGGWAW